MTVYFKAASREASRQTDIARLRGKAGALIHYVWRADLKALARASMDTAINSYHRDLLRYVERDGHREDVAATLTRHILSDSPDLMSAEMTALMEDAEAGDGVIEHLIVSVREGDDLLGNFDEAVEILVEALGLENCPVVGAVHTDSKFHHFHLVALRIDVETGQPVELPTFDIIRGHQALAVMEDRFGWQREADARWQVVDGRLMLDGNTDVGPANDPRQWPDGYFHHPELSANGRKVERQSGYSSAERHVREVVPAIIERNHNQAAFLADLATEGIELARAHRGAAYIVHTVDAAGRDRKESVKASVVRGWGWKALQERFGSLQTDEATTVLPAKAQPNKGDPARPRYAMARSQYHERLNAMLRNVRAAVPSGPAAKAGLAAARTACVFPTFDQWAAGTSAPEIGEVLFAQMGARVLEGGKRSAPLREPPKSDGKYGVLKSRGRVNYYRRGANGSTRLVDFGDSVVLVGPISEDEIRKALTLLALRGVRVVSGSGFTSAELRTSHQVGKDLGMHVVRHATISAITAKLLETQRESSAPAKSRTLNKPQTTRQSDDGKERNTPKPNFVWPERGLER
ncbi:hypothetical protein [Roseibium sp.]|uniref:relaxase/mobilization nuclease domain-containing protein n=1 Tax=Roseibium sp. TaxID=1936156 RepID=UPI003297290D